MSSGSKQSLTYAIETVVGTTPTPFDRKSLPFSTTTLDAATTKEDSVTILDSRLAQQGAITEVNYTGNIDAELRFGVFDDFIAGVAYNDWAVDAPTAGSDTLTFGGDLKRTFSVVRGFDDVENFHLFRGLHVNSMTLEIALSAIATVSFEMIGLGRTPSATAPTGTITTPTLPPTFSSLSVEDITIDGLTQKGVACISDLSFTWTNNDQTQRCLGNGLDIGAIIATLADGTGSFTMAWSKKAGEHYEKQFINKTSAITVTLKDGLGNIYVLTLPKVEFTAALPSGGNSDILQASFEYRVVEEAPTLTRTP